MVAAVKALKESGVGVTQTLEILHSDNPNVPLLPRDIYNARAAIARNPEAVATGLAENRAAIYSKPSISTEDRLKAELRMQLAEAKEELETLKVESQKEIESLKNTLKEKEKMISKFEMFIDLCNHRVTVRLEDDPPAQPGRSSDK
ncbi:hypothetical protein CFO_g1407 [Ceratocystis platani]|nr:hypothetical protein CFO_g1407 [Ceratocystis platani]